MRKLRMDPPFRLVAASFTAFHDDGSLDLERIPEQLLSLRADAVTGVFVCGTTGEGASLDEEERRQVVERWCVEAGSDFPVVAHVGHANLRVASELARHAVSAGARAVASVAPYFHRPARVEDLVDACAQVADAARQVPFFFYHLPSLTGVQVSMAEFLPLARERIPTFGGIKFTHDDLTELSRCLDLAGDNGEIMAGRDEILLPSLSLGVRSAVGSTYNFAAPIYAALARAFDDGDIAAARRAQLSARAMIDVVHEYGGLPALKAIASFVAVPCGPCRSPLRTLNDSERDQLLDDLKRIGFFDMLEQHRAAQRPEGNESDAREPTAS